MHLSATSNSRPAPATAPAPAPAADTGSATTSGRRQVRQVLPEPDLPRPAGAAAMLPDKPQPDTDVAQAARRFLDSYPALHRQKLERLDAGLLLERLTVWRDTLPPDSPQRAELGMRLEQPLSSQALFYTLTRQLQETAHWSCDREKAASAGCVLRNVYTSPWSPDGRSLALVTEPWRAPGPGCLVWERGAAGAQQPALLGLDRRFDCCALMFSADSRRLQAVGRQGEMQVWHRQADASWLEGAKIRLCDSSVTAVRWSPDARCLAVQVEAEVLLFGEQASGLWQQEASFEWIHFDPEPDDVREASYDSDDDCGSYGSRGEHRRTLVSNTPEVMCFSADSRHLLFVNGIGGDAFVVDRHDSGWKAHKLSAGGRAPYYREAGILAPDGDWAALVAGDCTHRSFRSHAWILQLWQYRSDSQGDELPWHIVSQRTCITTGDRFTLACSPDGQQLACPDRMDDGQLCTAILARTPSGSWDLTTRLPLGPDFLRPRQLDVTELAYSSQGRYLAAVTFSGVQIWQQTEGSFSCVAWIANSYPGVDLLFAFAPDGCHCAVAMDYSGQVSLHGPAPDGSYRTKARWAQSKGAEQLAWAPDGSRVMVTRQGEGLSDDRHINFLYLAPATQAQRGIKRESDCRVS